jgi:hypothetical protein
MNAHRVSALAINLSLWAGILAIVPHILRAIL